MNDGTRRFWLCADDYGISASVNAAIRDLIARGRINATSVMVSAPSFTRGEATSLLDVAAPAAAIGLHVTLTAPFAPLVSGFSPLRDGAFLTLSTVARRALMRSLNPESLAREIAGQFAAFRAAFGRAPDYVDGHHHIHVFPQIGEAVLRAIKDTAPDAWVRQCGRAVPLRRRFADSKALILDGLSRRFRRLAAQSSVRTNPAFAGAYAFNARADFARLFPSFLDSLPDGGVIMCHPGTVDAELVRLDPLTDLREREYAFLAGDSFPYLLAAQGAALAAREASRSQAVNQ